MSTHELLCQEEITQFNLSDAKHHHFVQIYRKKLFHLHHIEGIYVELMLTQVPFNTYGVPVAILERHDGNKWNPRLLTYTLVDISLDTCRTLTNNLSRYY
jgi:hypothetical protein